MVWYFGVVKFFLKFKYFTPSIGIISFGQHQADQSVSRGIVGWTAQNWQVGCSARENRMPFEREYHHLIVQSPPEFHFESKSFQFLWAVKKIKIKWKIVLSKSYEDKYVLLVFYYRFIVNANKSIHQNQRKQLAGVQAKTI